MYIRVTYLNGTTNVVDVFAVTNVGYDVCTVHFETPNSLPSEFKFSKRRVKINMDLLNFIRKNPNVYFWEWRDGRKKLCVGHRILTGIIDLTTYTYKNIPDKYLSPSKAAAIAKQKLNNRTYQEDNE